MKKANIITAQEAVNMIQDGSTLCTIGMTLISCCETLLKEVERKFLEEGHPRDLTFFHTCGQAAMKQHFGIQRLAHEGLLKRIIGGQRYERYMETVPIGDSEFHSPRYPLIDWKLFIFFPAYIMVVVWSAIVACINRLFFD